MYWLSGRRLRTGRSSPVFLVIVERREGKPSELGWTSSTVFGEQGPNYPFGGWSFLYICGGGSWLWWSCLDRRGRGPVCKGMRNRELITFLTQLSLESFSHAVKISEDVRLLGWSRVTTVLLIQAASKNLRERIVWLVKHVFGSLRVYIFLVKRWDHVRDFTSLYVDWHLFDPVVWSMLASWHVPITSLVSWAE
jgi:hypothetical protein